MLFNMSDSRPEAFRKPNIFRLIFRRFSRHVLFSPQNARVKKYINKVQIISKRFVELQTKRFILRIEC